jgi:hypothetical protein
MEEAKNCLVFSTMLSVWAAGQFLLGCVGCVWDERTRIQISPATHHHMSSMDPYKTDTDGFQFQQIQSIGSSMEETKNCLCGLRASSYWAVFGMKEQGSK